MLDDFISDCIVSLQGFNRSSGVLGKRVGRIWGDHQQVEDLAEQVDEGQREADQADQGGVCSHKADSSLKKYHCEGVGTDDNLKNYRKAVGL